VRQGRISTTAHALLGLLSFAGEVSGYELKQLGDRTLRFFWVSPAMSQVYSELGRLDRAGLVEAGEEAGNGQRAARRYRLTPSGKEELRRWLAEGEVAFPVIKHGVALRLFLGHMVSPDRIEEMLRRYEEQLEGRMAELEQIREGLGDEPACRYAALVAEWGQRYYREEVEAVRAVLEAPSRPRT
jgi:DNA-binding PadR family transcriptional regulator